MRLNIMFIEVSKRRADADNVAGVTKVDRWNILIRLHSIQEISNFLENGFYKAKNVAESRTKSMENNTTKTLLMDFVSVRDVLFILGCLERLINSNMPCFNVFYV